MALVGNLRDLKLPNLIQLNCMERNTAKLTIEHAGKYGIVYFHDGQIVHAEYDPDIGEKALYRLLVLSEGNFKVENGVRPPLITITTHWNNLLLEGLHQLDTRQSSSEGKDIRLLEMLMNVKGVKKAGIINREGKVVRSDFHPEKEFALQALSYFEVGKISQLLKREEPKYISMVVKSHRIILMAYNKDIIFIEIEAKYQLETVKPFIERVLN
jgi:predicted regulator of Ras-like GTPase activity (Roadblock/LC7/MglB family)